MWSDARYAQLVDRSLMVFAETMKNVQGYGEQQHGDSLMHDAQDNGHGQ